MISMSLSDAAKAIGAKHIGNNVSFTGCSTDTRTLQKDNLFIALHGERFDGHDYIDVAERNGASALMLSHEKEHNCSAIIVEDTRRAMGLLAGHWRKQLSLPVVAVTGSNGKTTVKEMVSSILSCVAKVHATRGNLNNDIGVPLTLFELNRDHQYAVIEMGANHSGEIKWLSSIACPNVAVITQCAPAHLEGFGSIEGVASAKAEIYTGLDSDGVAVINADDAFASYWQEACQHLNQCSFGIESNTADIRATNIAPSTSAINHFTLHTPKGDIDIHLPLAGRHNIMNALAASACCVNLDISLEVIKHGLEKMQAVKGRLQIKAGQNKSRIIDDTYNANPTSLKAAIDVLAAYAGKRYLALGDMGELGDASRDMHREAGQLAYDAKLDGLFSIGELSILASDNFGEGARHFDSFDKLSKAVLSILDANATVLVKGSRSMRMEQLVNAITEECA